FGADHTKLEPVLTESLPGPHGWVGPGVPTTARPATDEPRLGDRPTRPGDRLTSAALSIGLVRRGDVAVDAVRPVAGQLAGLGGWASVPQTSGFRQSSPGNRPKSASVL